MSTCQLLKNAIERGAQSDAMLKKKIEAFKKTGQLTEEEYNELIALIDNKA